MKLAAAIDLTNLLGMARQSHNARRLERALQAAGVSPVKQEKRSAWIVNLYDEATALRVLSARPGQRRRRSVVSAGTADADVATVSRLMRRTGSGSTEQAVDEWIPFADVLEMSGRGKGYSVKTLYPLLFRLGLMSHHKVMGEGKGARHLFLKSKVLEVIDGLRSREVRPRSAASRAEAVARVESIVALPRVEKMPEAPRKYNTVEDYLKATLETVQSLQKELRSLQVQVAPMVKATPGMMQLLGNIQDAICSNPLEPERGVVVATNKGVSLDSPVPA